MSIGKLGKHIHNSSRLIISIFLFVLVIPIIFHFSYFLGHIILEGNMMGGDTAYHLSWIHTLQQYFPRIPLWFPNAGGGQSIVLGYWVFPYYLAILIDYFSNFSVEQGVRILEFVSVPIVSIEIYIYIWVRYRNQIMATLAALLYPMSAVAWGWTVHAGFFSMQMSTVMLLPPFMFFDLYLNHELKQTGDKTRMRLYLLGFAISLAIAILIHGSGMPSILLGLPVYALVRSQIGLRKKEPRYISFLRSVKVVVLCTVTGLLMSSFFFIPQLKYFSFQSQSQGFSYGADIPFLPWRGFLGFDLLNPDVVGPLYTPLSLSTLVGIFALVGIVFAFIKRTSLAAMGTMAMFYVVWMAYTPFIKDNLPFLNVFLNPTNVRSVSIAAIFMTILAAYGLWSVADLPGILMRFIGKKIGKKSEFISSQLAFIIATIVVFPLTIFSFNSLQEHGYFPGTGKGRDYVNIGYAAPFPGYKTLDPSAPFCNVLYGRSTLSERECVDYAPKDTIDTNSWDIAPIGFDEATRDLNLSRATRVSVSPALGSLAFAFADHADASMVQTPSSQATSIIPWIGLHNGTLFLNEGNPEIEELGEVAKWFGVRYAFFNTERDDKVLLRFTDDTWSTVASTEGVGGITVKELIDSPGMVVYSSKPAILVIGSIEKKAFTDVYKVATKGGFSYDQAHLVQGTQSIDDYSLDELGRFSLIILHGYEYRNARKTWDKISSFVKNGGSVFIDNGWQFVAEDWEGDDLPEPYPVTETSWGDLGTTWDRAALNTEIGEVLDLNEFGAPVWGGSPWGMALATKDSLRPWAEPVLSVGDSIIVARGSLGEGKVVWSGMNLISHTNNSQMDGEFEFVGNIIDYLLDDVGDVGETRVNWDYPDRIDITFSKVLDEPGFLYLTDAWTPNWKAYLVKNGKQEELEIYRAGTGFKAVYLEDLSEETKLVFKYSQRKTIILSSALTIVTLLLFVIAILDAWLLKGVVEKKLFGRFMGKQVFSVKRVSRSISKKKDDLRSWSEHEDY